MREIKFRGWNTIDGGWVYGDLTHIDKNGIHINPLTGGGITSFTYSVKLESVGQYTGLKDKNGVEIYEGDIITILTENKHLVKFENGGFGYKARLTGDFIGLCEFNYLSEIEVVGNIHEEINNG